jgi:hypothetical protein
VRCRTFGGDGFAANCTTERTITGYLGPESAAQTNLSALGQGAGALALALRGFQRLTIGKERNGVIPVVMKETDIQVDPVQLSLGPTCACVRGVAGKTCGGTLFEADGITLAANCTLQDNCAALGKPPCMYVHGEGNSLSGFIGCGGIEPVNIDWVQDAGGQPLPPIGQVPPGSGPPNITLFGFGGPGNGLFLNTQRIGTFTGQCANRVPTPPPTCPPPPGAPPTPLPTPTPFLPGPDGLFCTDDDPEAARGTPVTIAMVTGTVRVYIENQYYSGSGPSCVIDTLPRRPPSPTPFPPEALGAPFNCAQLLGDQPSLVGAGVAGGFTALNTGSLGNVVTSFRFLFGTETPTPSRTPTRTPTNTFGPNTRTFTPTRTSTPTRTPTPLPPCPEVFLTPTNTPPPTFTPKPCDPTRTPTPAS